MIPASFFFHIIFFRIVFNKLSFPSKKETGNKFLANIIWEHTWPASSTRILSQSIMVFSLWAMTSIVHDLNSSRMVFWIRASVLTSTEAVASSRTRILDLRSSARARLSSCLCPTLKFSPPSKTLDTKTNQLYSLLYLIINLMLCTS
jgi:hypothetical protein